VKDREYNSKLYLHILTSKCKQLMMGNVCTGTQFKSHLQITLRRRKTHIVKHAVLNVNQYSNSKLPLFKWRHLNFRLYKWRFYRYTWHSTTETTVWNHWQNTFLMSSAYQKDAGKQW